MTGWKRDGWEVVKRGGNVAGSATWYAKHSCGATSLLLGAKLRSEPPKYCDNCRPVSQSASRRARGELCRELYGVTYGQLHYLLVAVAGWRDGEKLTAAFLEREAGIGRAGHEFQELEKLRLVERRGRVANTLYYAPTRTGLARIGDLGRERAV